MSRGPEAESRTMRQSRQIYAVARNAWRTDGFLFVGGEP